MRVAVAGLVAVLLAGCSSDVGLLTGAGATADPQPAVSGATSDTPVSAFNPFNTAPETAGGGREVIANPSLADVMLAGELPEMSWGRADAPVTIIKYASLTCPYCRRFQLETFPQLKREMIDTGKVRYIIREFPIGKASGTATIALRCASPDKYLALYEKFLTQQASWVSQEVRPDAIFAVASQVGMKRADFDQCLANRAMIAQLNWIKDRGRKLGVIGTPNFFINGRLVKSVIGMKEIRDLVEQAGAGKTAAKS